MQGVASNKERQIKLGWGWGKRQRVKTQVGNYTRKLFPKTTDREKEEGYNTTSFYKQLSTESEVWEVCDIFSIVPGELNGALVRKQGKAPGSQGSHRRNSSPSWVAFGRGDKASPNAKEPHWCHLAAQLTSIGTVILGASCML